jgi:hypothetical protein
VRGDAFPQSAAAAAHYKNASALAELSMSPLEVIQDAGSQFAAPPLLSAEILSALKFLARPLSAGWHHSFPFLLWRPGKRSRLIKAKSEIGRCS